MDMNLLVQENGIMGPHPLTGTMIKALTSFLGGWPIIGMFPCMIEIVNVNIEEKEKSLNIHSNQMKLKLIDLITDTKVVIPVK